MALQRKYKSELRRRVLATRREHLRAQPFHCSSSPCARSHSRRCHSDMRLIRSCCLLRSLANEHARTGIFETGSAEESPPMTNRQSQCSAANRASDSARAVRCSQPRSAYESASASGYLDPLIERARRACNTPRVGGCLGAHPRTPSQAGNLWTASNRLRVTVFALHVTCFVKRSRFEEGPHHAS